MSNALLERREELRTVISELKEELADAEKQKNLVEKLISESTIN